MFFVFFCYFFFIIFFEVFWLIVSRLVGFEPVYFYSDLDFNVISYLFIIGIVLLCSLVVLSSIFYWVQNNKKIMVTAEFILWISVAFNFLFLLMSDTGFRYSSTGTDGLTLLVYYLSSLISLLAVLSVVSADYRISRVVLIFFILSLVLKVDGLSSALLLFSVIVLFSISQFKLRFFTLIVICFFIFLLGVFSKWSDPASLNYGELLGWIAARFAIPAEVVVTYLQGEHYLSDTQEVLDMLRKTLSCRFGFILNSAAACSDEIRSIGGANYYTLYGKVKGGSSPGLLGSVVFLSIWSVFAIIALSFVVAQIFRFVGKIGIVEVFCLFLITRPLYGDFADLYAVLSINTIYVIGVLLFCYFVKIGKYSNYGYDR